MYTKVNVSGKCRKTACKHGCLRRFVVLLAFKRSMVCNSKKGKGRVCEKQVNEFEAERERIIQHNMIQMEEALGDSCAVIKEMKGIKDRGD